MVSSSRRRYLRSCAVVLGLTTAGCIGSDQFSQTDSAKTRTTTAPNSTTTGPTSTAQADVPVAWRRSLGSAVTTTPTSSTDSLYVGTKSGTLVSLTTAEGKQEWSQNTQTEIPQSPVHVGDTMFIVVGKNELFANQTAVALDAETGTKRWEFSPEEWWLEIVGVTDETLYVATSDDAIGSEGQTLYALSVAAGSKQWSGEIGDPSGGLLAHNSIYVPSYGRLYAYDARTGEQQWTTDITDYSYRTIAATDETVCFASNEEDAWGKLITLDSRTGEVKWSHDEWPATSTTLHEGTLYVGGEYVAAFDPDSGDQRWKVDRSGFIPRAPVQDGRLYAGGDAVRAYTTDNGEIEWTWKPDVDVEGVTPVAASAETLYIGSWRKDNPRNRFKFALDPMTGEQQWMFEDGTELTDLSFDGTHAYVGSAKGNVYAF